MTNRSLRDPVRLGGNDRDFMHDPWTVLNLEPSADEATIRRRYLELVRENPPDRDPDRFHEIRTAYDLVRDPTHRLEKLLFDVRSDEQLDTLVAHLQARMRGSRIPTVALLQLADLP